MQLHKRWILLILILMGWATESMAGWLMLGNTSAARIEVDDLYQATHKPRIIWVYRAGEWEIFPAQSSYTAIRSIKPGEGFWVFSDGNASNILTSWREYLQKLKGNTTRKISRGWFLSASDHNATLLIDKIINDNISTLWYYRKNRWYTTIETTSYDSFYKIENGLGFWAYRSTFGDMNWSIRHLFLDTDGDKIDDQIDSDRDGLCDNAEKEVGTDPKIYDDDLLMRDTYADQMTLLASKDLNLSLKAAWRYMSGKARPIRIAVVDSGILSIHPDLKANLDIQDSFRYPDEKGKSDPVGDENDVDHGTICAGIIAARGFNDEGVRGVAPLKTLVALNVFHDPTDANFIAALANNIGDVSSNSWGYGSESFIEDPALRGIEEGIRKGRKGMGTVYVFAAGNEGEDANTVSDIHNSRYVMTVSAVDRHGRLTDYANYGANIFVVAPGGTDGDGMVSTDFDRQTWQPVYGMPEDNLEGTSFATPVVSGIAALVLDANPYLSWRDVQHIIAQTANRNDPTDSSWHKNGAGMWISEKYGFGTPNAYRAVRKAFGWQNLPVESSSRLYQKIVQRIIPDDDNSGISSEIVVDENMSVEHVDVWITTRDPKDGEGDPSLQHRRTCYDDLRVEIISPSGTRVVLDQDQISQQCGNLNNWHYGTHLFMGEKGAGKWRLRILDTYADYQGVWQKWSLQLFGH